jgi:hypothetical protein
VAIVVLLLAKMAGVEPMALAHSKKLRKDAWRELQDRLADCDP